jgi:digeranylgeranylglycerophospholipid reductase
MKYDLIVVGGGPGGLMAAKTAAEDGLKVILVERKRNITKINRACLQIFYIRPISPLTGGKTYMEPVSAEVGADKTRFHFLKPGFSVDYTGPLRPYLNWLQFSPSGHLIHRWKPNDKIWGFFYRKEAFVAGLLASVEKAGVEVRTETIALGAENIRDGVKVRVQGKSAEQTLEARAAIAADGIRSRIVDSLGLNEKRQVLASSVKGVMNLIDGIETDLPVGCSLISFTIPSIVTRRNIIVGMMAENMNSISAGTTPYEKLAAHPTLAPMLRHARLVKMLAFGGTIRTPIREPVAGNVVIVGDSGAPTETWIAGAVACGYQAVRAIEKELNGQKGYQEYIDWWQQAFAFNTPNYFKVVSDYYAWSGVCSDKDVDYIFSLFQDKVGIPALLIEENLELIRGKMPALYEKLRRNKQKS